MHEIEKIAAAVERLTGEGRRGILVTVVGTHGSTYRRAGARCVISDRGEVTGAISGGCVERDLAERAKSWGGDMTARVITYDSSSPDDIVFGLGLGCRGKIEMLVQPFDEAHRPLLPRAQSTAPRAATVHAVVISCADGRHRPGDAIEVEGDHARTTRVVIDGDEVLVEVIRPQRSIVVFGGGADAEPVASLAQALGWRAELITAKSCHPDEVKTRIDLTAFDAAVVMTHNFLHDVALLDALFASPVPYIGLLGPKSRGEELLTQLGSVTQEMRDRLHNPIGLDIGGDTPEEIALSIVAEIQAFHHGRRADRLRDRSGPIHELAETEKKTCV